VEDDVLRSSQHWSRARYAPKGKVLKGKETVGGLMQGEDLAYEPECALREWSTWYTMVR